jgi:hypothetical protein
MIFLLGTTRGGARWVRTKELSSGHSTSPPLLLIVSVRRLLVLRLSW